MKYFSFIAILLVSIAIIAGFFVVGSPQSERLREFDARRINDISAIQNYVVDYWQNKNELPPDLVILNDKLRGIRVPADPETGESYGYEVQGPLTFALCATFNLRSDGDIANPEFLKAVDPFGDRVGWDHPEGRHCFERTIDPDFFSNENFGRPTPAGL